MLSWNSRTALEWMRRWSVWARESPWRQHSPSPGLARWSAWSACHTGSTVRSPDTIVFRNVGLRGGVAPARAYIPLLLDDVLEGRINPGRVFDFETSLDGIGEAYAAMDERRAIKSLVRIDQDGHR